MTEFSDYIVYADESGDHSLVSIDKDYPLFCLAFCVIKKDDYVNEIVPAIQSLKFKYFGHDTVVLHEHDIRKEKKDFSILRTSSALRSGFLDELTGIIRKSSFQVISSVIKKDLYRKRSKVPDSPYEIALLFCMERLFLFLKDQGQAGKTVHVVFECRGKREDKDLELYFRRIISGQETWGYRSTNFSEIDFIPIFRHKQANLSGVQLADLSARPIGLSVLRPQQDNRAFDTISDRVTIKCFP